VVAGLREQGRDGALQMAELVAAIPAR
jgi:hypothetical protein